MSDNKFFTVVVKKRSATEYDIEADFNPLVRDSDIVTQGGDFKAYYDENSKLWVTDERIVGDVVDAALWSKYDEVVQNSPYTYHVKAMRSGNSGAIDKWHKYVQKQLRDTRDTNGNGIEFDSKLAFANTDIKREDYITKRLPYSIEDGPTPAYDELMDTLFDQTARDKLEWASGAIVAGDAKNIQKFVVLYGPPESGKSTYLNILGSVFGSFVGYFVAKDIVNSSKQFALEPFANNPLVGIQHDGDLSKIEDNSVLNSLVSHETIIMNRKNMKQYPMRFNAFLFMGTNRPVKITEAKSGLLRRLIDVSPSGRKIEANRYTKLMEQIEYELGSIAFKWREKYLEMGKHYYDAYVPMSMLSATNDFYDFVEYNYEAFVKEECVSLKDAWALYSSYCDMAKVPYPLSYRPMRAELENYFEEFKSEYRDKEGRHLRSVFVGFKKDKFASKFVPESKKKTETWLKFDGAKSIFDLACNECPAQLANATGVPKYKWDACYTTLQDINTRMLHFVKPPINHIVLDFDIKDPQTGEKSRALNIEAASKFPPTYAELSKSGEGIHLHYIYDGDVEQLSAVYDENIEVKVFKGNSSLRRKLSECNSLSIATISSGLPLRKKEKAMVDFNMIKNDRHLRALIIKAINKEIHANTKPNMDYIKHILDQAYANKELHYDVSDMYQAVLYFASCSHNNADYCIKLLEDMKWKSEEDSPLSNVDLTEEAQIVFFDVEVFPNLFLINWKFQGPEHECVRMINPTALEVASLFKHRLIGFNNRRYDNHILYARTLGYSNEELFRLSQKLINDNKSASNKATFANAFNLSYTDVYDFCATKKSLKRWEIDLGIRHKELHFAWDKPVPEELWDEVAKYCDNDVIATEAVFDANQGDWIARQIISELSGLSVNATGNAHSAAIIFEGNKNPQGEFVYTDLSEVFVGYTFDHGKSMYLGELIGEGGYVYAEPGMYSDVVTFDVMSMHPHSAIALNIFGDRYTKRFKDLVDLRVHIKHKEFDVVKSMFNGVLAKFVESGAEDMVKALSYALKIVINSVYGLTSAKFDNPFRDVRNIDNIVAKRGALFMCTLKNKIQEMGVKVIHCKTDSIKLASPSEELKQFVYDFGAKYGYTFEIEDVYSKLCLVNDAVYIAKEAETNEWTATGAQFKQPYVFKTLFSREPLVFADVCETKQVKTAMHLDFNEQCPDEHDYQFIGKVGLFTPVKSGQNGGNLVVERQSSTSGTGIKYDSVTGTKGYRWVESETIADAEFSELMENVVDVSYYTELVDKAKDTINKFGDIETFID